MSPLLFEVRGRNVFCPPYFLREEIPIVVDLLNSLMTVLSHPLNIIMHSKTHLIRLAAGLRPDPLGDSRDPSS